MGRWSAAVQEVRRIAVMQQLRILCVVRSVHGLWTVGSVEIRLTPSGPGRPRHGLDPRATDSTLH
jgi:hypothetical protein